MFSPSQSLGMGLSQAPSQDTAGKKAKSEDRQSCLPLTVRAVEAALEQNTGNSDELRFYGCEHGMLVLVGVVESLTKQPSCMEFSVNDTTGRIKARYYLTDNQPKELLELKSGHYVNIFGNVRTAPFVHFVATGMRIVQSADEISYHLIESAHAALKLQGGVAGKISASPQKHMQTKQPDVGISQEAQPQVTIAVPEKASQSLDGVALRSAILAFLRQEADTKPEGSSLDTLFAHTEPTPKDHVRKSLEQLVDDGEVFTTIDDEHFSCV